MDADRQIPAEAEAFLAYWFGLQPEQWWKRDPAFDQALRERFGDLYRRLAAEVPESWLESPRGLLAAVMVLDQLPRNFFRDNPRAYGTDAKALALAKSAVARGIDQQLSADVRVFLYLPFEHSEQAADQARSVELYTALGDANALDFAHKHKDIIDRFGRFPHRNKVLGRASTPEEIEFLKKPGAFW
jgi:uncharacterized protein (DUF924 family)